MSENNKQDKVKLDGVVTEVNHNTIFVEVKLGENAHKIKAYPSGKMRINSVMIIVGDQVQVECSPHDLTQGRIVYRGPPKT